MGVAYFNRGVIHETLRAYNEAVIDYSNAIQADPTNAGAYYNRGIVYREIGELDAALLILITASL